MTSFAYGEAVSILGRCKSDLDKFSRFLAMTMVDPKSENVIADEIIKDICIVANQLQAMFNKHFNPRVRNAAKEAKEKETGGAGTKPVHSVGK